MLDVRSPGEYAKAHIPGALNLPLFSNEERKVVGTAYKQESRENAIKLGLDYFGPNMRPMVEAVEAMTAGKGKKIYVYCWRGGMRSGAVAWLLDLYGFKVFALHGGYKTYRRLALELFEQEYPFSIVGGYTGSGKTELLLEMEKSGECLIDLEGLACHRGSAFGSLGQAPQPSQEMFENLLAAELLRFSAIMAEKPDTAIWLEDESQRIGDLNLPINLWNYMRNRPLFFIDIPFEERLEHILANYGQYPAERLENAILRISKRLGGLETKNALQFLHEGDLKSCFRILLHYYDKWYLKGLKNRKNLDEVIRPMPMERVAPAENAARLLEKRSLAIK